MSVHITLRGRFLHDFAGRIFDLHMNSCLILYKSLYKFHGITIDERLWLWYKTLIINKVTKGTSITAEVPYDDFLTWHLLDHPPERSHLTIGVA